MWKWILIPIAVLVVLVLIVLVIGLFVPKTHTASRRVRYERPAAVVWDLVSRFEDHARWRPGIERMERLEDRDGRPVWKEVRGRGDAMSMAIEEFDPPRRMVTRVVDNRQFGGTWTWEVEQEGDDACVLTITEDGEIYNPVFRFVARFVIGYHGVMDGVHAALQSELGGEVAGAQAH